MSSDIVLCGPCGYEHSNKNAKTWCTNCEEGFCGDCEKIHRATKMSRDHKLITIEDYQKISNVTISLICEDHGKKLNLYCKAHDTVLCLACIPSRHSSCSDVIPLDEAARNVKTSTAFIDLGESITAVRKYVEKFVHNRDEASKNLERQEQNVKKEIADTRTKMNELLDEIEQRLIHELSTKYTSLKYKNEELLKHLKMTEKLLTRLNEQILQIKQFASDLQVFLGTRQIKKTVTETMNSVMAEVGNVENYNIQLQVHPVIRSLLTEIRSLGNIKTEVTQTGLPLTPPAIEQAQIPVAMQNTTINGIEIILKQNINVKEESFNTWITGCSTSPHGHLMIADYWGKKKITQYNQEGSHIKDIPVSENPFDLTWIDSNHIAVSYGHDHLQCIEIININNNKVEKTIKTEIRCNGISFQSGKLYTAVSTLGIVEMNLFGEIVRIFPADVADYAYVATAKDRIYYSDIKRNAVICCTSTGKEIWRFRHNSLIDPSGLATDDNQNVFVAGKGSNAVIVISRDGKTSKTLLTASDGLNHPSAVCYSEDHRVLLVCNEHNGKCFVCFVGV